MDRKDLAGLSRMTVLEDGAKWRVVTLVCQTEIGRLGMLAIGVTPQPTRGLSRRAAVALAREIEAALDRQDSPKDRGRGRRSGRNFF